MIRLAILAGLGLWLAGCQSADRSAESISLTATVPVYPHPDSIAHLSGEQLAYRYCQGCHLFPDPKLLPKTIWTENVLPRMGHRLGIRASPQEPYQGMSMYNSSILSYAGIFPDEPRISEAGWKRLVAYYEQQAVDSLLMRVLPAVDTVLKYFQPHPIRLPAQMPPITTLIHYDPFSNHLFLGDRRGMLYEINDAHVIVDSIAMDSPPADIITSVDGSRQVLTMGVMNPSDRVLGKLWELPAQADSSRLFPENLRRPVHLAQADLNQDNRQDWVISEFGNFLGQLAWHESLGDAGFRKHTLVADPGARRTEVVDLNEDGLPDIVALLAQGDERIIAWYNQGEGKFRPQVLLRFPSIYGSSYFELADFNQDKRLDILYTNGDNADYSPLLKPYHGIRIFLQSEAGKFQESYFLAMPGASKAMARDFDQDGDLDIAAISFFPDFERTPERGFLYLENQSPSTSLTFSAQTFPEAVGGHWLTMDTGDTDQDGDLDIILGSFALLPSQASTKIRNYWAKEGPNYIILENKVKSGASAQF